ncbi:MAG TPA: hypothetical protein VHI78_00845 [Bacteroidales bacterium]|jgi:hypothetical protein|nr:hypothetical protein [Bacteroidales bacterium]
MTFRRWSYAMQYRLSKAFMATGYLPKVSHSEPDLEDMSYCEKFYYGQKEPVSAITGIDVSLLPPSFIHEKCSPAPNSITS